MGRILSFHAALLRRDAYRLREACTYVDLALQQHLLRQAQKLEHRADQLQRGHIEAPAGLDGLQRLWRER